MFLWIWSILKNSRLLPASVATRDHLSFSSVAVSRRALTLLPKRPAVELAASTAQRARSPGYGARYEERELQQQHLASRNKSPSSINPLNPPPPQQQQRVLVAQRRMSGVRALSPDGPANTTAVASSSSSSSSSGKAFVMAYEMATLKML